MTELASDDFNRADNTDLGANWNNISGSTGPLTIFTNAVRWTAALDDGTEVYDGGIAWPNDQYSQCTVTGSGASGANPDTGPGVCVRGSAGTNMYRVCIGFGASSGETGIAKFVSAAHTALGAFGTDGFVSGDVLRVEVSGSTITVFRNGTQVEQRTDTSITSGNPGLSYSSVQGDSHMDDWSGGDLQNPVTYGGSPRRGLASVA